MTIQLDFTGATKSTRGKGISPPPRDANSLPLVDQKPVTTQYTVLIASNETIPYTFTGIATDDGSPLTIMTQSESLGVGWGDYSLRGMHPALFGQSRPGTPGERYPIISIERKSQDDAHSTILGWGQHRDNFIRELGQLNQLTFAAIIVECTEPELYATAPEWGQKTAAENRKSLARSIDAWRIEFPRVQWIFMQDRRMAEVKCFRILDRFWKENHRK